ncbi:MULTISPECIES: AAA family ATPase [unclassified Cupriavidus]|uniref:AAA family ATPase n=1 Tax=unclassified Cupriavidus TaxID=2640874 RepID=UPI00313D97A2
MLRLKKLTIENSGAIETLNVEPPFWINGRPKPLILVGENGSGKTTALSFIVDSLLQAASLKFNDVLATQGMSNLFYRIRSHDIRIGASSAITHVQYEWQGQPVHFLDRVGAGVDMPQIRQRLNLPVDLPTDDAAESEKTWTPNVEEAAASLKDGVYVFFPGGRREMPHWFHAKGLHPERYTITQRFASSIGKNMIVETAAQETASWIMDGLLDAAAGYRDTGIGVANQILQAILEDSTAHFAVAPRNVSPRVQIFTGTAAVLREHNTRRMLIPSLAHLSAGQAMLLSMFGTIANQGTLNQRRALSEIEGIVIIDEVEVYLHTHLQRKVLPKLIRLFPNVQFVVTTHSPAFLMGMKDEFGPDGFEIRDMPSGSIIDVDQFGEIGAAVEALSQSTAFRDEVKAEVARENERPLLVVEGRSDAILIEGLWRMSMHTPPPFKIMTAHGRRGLRYLLEDDQFTSEVGQNQSVLGLFDFDEAYDDWNGCSRTYPNREGDDVTGLLRRHVAKQIYAGLLPVPAIRAMQAGERFARNSTHTIELYLPDELLNEGQNLDLEVFPGDITIKKFRGDKVAFARRVGQERAYLPHFEQLLALIRRVLAV